MSEVSVVREVLDDVRGELWHRRAQVCAALSYVVLLFGFLVLFSSIGEDSHHWYDTVERTTLTAVGIGMLALFLALGALTLAVDKDVRRRTVPGAEPRYLRSRRRFVTALACGVALCGAGVVALATWA